MLCTVHEVDEERVHYREGCLVIFGVPQTTSVGEVKCAKSPKQKLKISRTKVGSIFYF